MARSAALNCGVVLPGFSDEGLQADRSVLSEGGPSPKDTHADFPDLRHFSSHTIGDEVHTRTHQRVFALLRATKGSDSKDVELCGGLPGGDSNVPAAGPTITG